MDKLKNVFDEAKEILDYRLVLAEESLPDDVLEWARYVHTRLLVLDDAIATPYGDMEMVELFIEDMLDKLPSAPS